MSGPGSALPERPSLEQLRKRAKDLLRAWRMGEPAARERMRAGVRQLATEDPARDAVLADAQHTIAREHGFESWAKLVRHVKPEEPSLLEHLEGLAVAVAAAYTTGDFTRVREINWQHGTSFYWDRDPDNMRRRLPAWFAATDPSDELALADARHLVARMYGAETWDHLVGSRAEDDDRTAPFVRTHGAPFYRIDDDGRTLRVTRPVTDAEWDVVLGVLRERRVEGVHPGQPTDGALALLAELDHLKRVDLGGATRHTDRGVQLLAGLPQLEELDLGGVRSPVTDRGLEVLEHLPRLRRLALCWAPRPTDVGLAGLASCDRVEHVDLLGTRTGDGAIRALAGKAGLRRLHTGRDVTDRGLPLLRRIPAFAAWQGGEPEYGLMSFAAGPTHLLLDGPISDRGTRHLVDLAGVFGLSFFWHVSRLTSAGLAPLAEMANLGFLGCQGALCDDGAMRHIARVPKLRMLMAQGTVAGDDGFDALSRSRTLEHLWGRECPNLGSRGFAALGRMPALKGLAVSCRGADDTALAELPRFPALEELMPMDVGDDGFRHVGRCERLEALWCMYCRDTGDAATDHLSGLTRLRSYYAGDTRITDHSLRVLGGMDSLESITLWQCAGVTDAGVRELTRLPRLRELTLDGLQGVSREVEGAFPDHVTVTLSG